MRISQIVYFHTVSFQEGITLVLVAAAAIYSLYKLIMLFVPGKTTVHGRELCGTCSHCRHLLSHNRKNKKPSFFRNIPEWPPQQNAGF